MHGVRGELGGVELPALSDPAATRIVGIDKDDVSVAGTARESVFRVDRA
jgi:hypothetical protein